SFGFEQWGPGGSSKVSEQWGTDAVADPIQVQALQTIYRKAFGLPPLPTPNFIVAARKTRAKDAQSSRSSNGSESESSKSGDSGSSNGDAPELEDGSSLEG